MPTAPTALVPLGTPPNDTTQVGPEFVTAAENFIDSQFAWSDSLVLIGANVYNNALEAQGFATTAAADAVTAANQAAISTTKADLSEQWATSLTEVSGGLKGARGYAEDAQAAAASTSADFTATSSTSLLIEVANKTFAIETGKAFVEGQPLRIVSDADINNYMIGQITNAVDGSITVNVTNIGGSGTFSDWVISIYQITGTELDLKADADSPEFTGEVTFDGDTGAAGEVLQSQGVGLSPIWAAIPQAADYQEFTSSGTWTKPSGVNFVYIEMWAGGGGGGNTTGTGGAGGGSGGEYLSLLISESDLLSSESVVVGAGGAGGGSGGDNYGSNGGNSSFAGVVTAVGGNGGASVSTLIASIPRTTSDYIDSALTSTQSSPQSGIGGTQGAGGSCIYGGGGGGGSNNYTGGVSEFAGSGGDGNGDISVPANSGWYPSGGGGGSRRDGGGGDGADGLVRVWAW